MEWSRGYGWVRMLHTKRTDRAADTYTDMARYDPLKLRKKKFSVSTMRRGDDYRPILNWHSRWPISYFYLGFFSVEHMVVFSIGWGSGILSGSSPHQISKPIRDLAVSHHPPPQTLSFHPGNAVPLLYWADHGMGPDCTIKRKLCIIPAGSLHDFDSQRLNITVIAQGHL